MNAIPSFDPEDVGHAQTVLDDLQWAYDGIYARLAQLPDPHARQIWLTDITWPYGRQEAGEPPMITLQKAIANLALSDVFTVQTKATRHREAQAHQQDYPRG